MKVLDRDKLEVGDTIAVEKDLYIGWTRTGLKRYEKGIVESISPKRNSIVVNGVKLPKYNTIYAWNKEAERCNEIAEVVTKSVHILDRLKKVYDYEDDKEVIERFKTIGRVLPRLQNEHIEEIYSKLLSLYVNLDSTILDLYTDLKDYE